MAVDDFIITIEGNPIEVDLLQNDQDAESEILSISSLTSPGFGIATLDATTGLVSYVPNLGFAGNDYFNYTVTDASGETATATVHVTIEAFTTACSPTISSVDKACSISPTNHKMKVLAFGLCTSTPTRPNTTSNYDISMCELIYDGRQTGGVSVSVAGGSTVDFSGSLIVPSYGNYSHGILIVDNTFTIQGELTLASGTRPHCYIEDKRDTNGDGLGDSETDLDGNGVNDLFVNCRATKLSSPPEVEDRIGNFFGLTPSAYSYTFADDQVTLDLVTSEASASNLSSSDSASDAIFAIQAFGSPKNFNAFTQSIDVGVRISDSLVVGSGGAETSPFSIQFSVR